MLAEQQRIQKEKERIQKQIFKLPAGTIFCFQNGTHVKWYEKDGKRRQYLPKDQRKYAEKLAMKKISAAADEGVDTGRAGVRQLHFSPSGICVGADAGTGQPIL